MFRFRCHPRVACASGTWKRCAMERSNAVQTLPVLVGCVNLGNASGSRHRGHSSTKHWPQGSLGDCQCLHWPLKFPRESDPVTYPCWYPCRRFWWTSTFLLLSMTHARGRRQLGGGLCQVDAPDCLAGEMKASLKEQRRKQSELCCSWQTQAQS